MKKNYGIILSLILVIIASLPSSAVQYGDVPVGYWAYNEIDRLTNENIMSGKDNLFRPASFITRKEYAKVLVKLIGGEKIPIEKTYSFEDINSSDPDWKYAVRALNFDILTPVETSRFEPDGYVTRIDMITFAVNLLRSEGITKKEALNALQNAYDDYDKIPDWFKATAGRAEVMNVIAKEPSGQRLLDCDSYLTRAQTAVFVQKIRAKIQEYKDEAQRIASSPKKGEGIVIENTLRKGDVVTLPMQTILPIYSDVKLNSKTTKPGEKFNAHFVNNIVNENHEIIFSKDTVLTGRVLDGKKAAFVLKNGSFLIDLFSVNSNGNPAKIYAIAECGAINTSANKVLRTVKHTVKGKNLVITSDDTIYVKLYKPLKVNIVTGDIFE